VKFIAVFNNQFNIKLSHKLRDFI